MTGPCDCFAPRYAAARALFLQQAALARGAVDVHAAPWRGAQGEALAMDVVRLGPPTADRVLLVTSGCHGVEGHAGSAVQVALLRDRALAGRLARDRIALWLVHGLDPHGFSFARRVTQENVDLNRNAIDFGRPLPVNPGYRELHAHLVPARWPAPPEADRALTACIQRLGLRHFQDVVSRGQYEFDDGLFFGGRAATWSLKTFAAWLRRARPGLRHAAWIDLHTGLGAEGAAEPIFTGGAAGAEALAREWWPGITSTADGTASSAVLHGTLADAVLSAWGDRLRTSMTLEFGTVPPLQVLAALRADAVAWRLSPSAAADTARQEAERQMRAAFLIDRPAWRAAVIEQGVAAVFAGVAGLRREGRGAPAPSALRRSGTA